MQKTILYSLAFIALGLGAGSLGPTLPALAAQAHVELSQASNLFVARSLGTMFGSWLMGGVYDRRAGHPLLAVSLLGLAVALALMPLGSVLWVLLAVSAFLGVSSASINVGGNAMIVQEHGDRVRPFLSAMHFAFGLGGFLAPLLIARFITRPDGLQWSYWALALATLPALALVLLARSPVPHAHHARVASAPLPVFTLALFVLYFFLEVGAEASVMGWYFTYAVRRGVDAQTAAFMNSGFWGMFSLGRLTTIWTARRLGAGRLVAGHLAVTLLITVTLLIFPASPPMLWFGALGMGLAIGPVFPNTFGLAQRIVGLSGRVTGWLLVGSAAAGLFWPWLVGQFFESRGPQVLLWTATINLLGAFAVLAVVVMRARKQNETVSDDELEMPLEP